ncbi:MAG: hypothetical protein HQ553_16105, partial [Chloroflexi bacterium]|nr:hypothetical protein [Chloroflexota bacterium]
MPSRIGMIGMAVMLLLLSLSIGCTSGEPSPSPLVRPTATPEMPETPPDVVITIGNLSDLTGVSSNAMVYINMALDDLIKYYNENNLIPGVRLNVITYDGQMNPA